MDRLLYTAMSGAKQSMDLQAIINHNLANAATPGFRAELQAMRAVPVQGDGLPTRTMVAATSVPSRAKGKQTKHKHNTNTYTRHILSHRHTHAHTHHGGRGDLGAVPGQR